MRRWRRPALVLGLALLVAPPLAAQEILQALVLELAVLEVHAIVARARGDEQLECVLRDRGGRVRVAASQPLSAGLTSGGTTILSIPLPLLAPGETDFAVVLRRGEAVLHRTAWQPIFTPTRGARP